MVLCDFLSRQNSDNSNPHEIIPISFNIYQVLHEKYYNAENYLVQTRSQARSSGIKLPDIHGVGRNLDPNIKAEEQHANPIKGSIEKPHIGQGRAGVRRKRPDPINQTIIQPSELPQKIPGETKRETTKTHLCKFHRSNAFHKQCGLRDDAYKTFNSRCSLLCRSNLQAPPKPFRSNTPRG